MFQNLGYDGETEEEGLLKMCFSSLFHQRYLPHSSRNTFTTVVLRTLLSADDDLRRYMHTNVPTKWHILEHAVF